MKRDAVQAGEFFEAGTGCGIDGITFGDVAELDDRGSHLLESTGGEKGCQSGGESLPCLLQGGRQLLLVALGNLRLRCNRREPVRLLALTLHSSASSETSPGSW
jgi:hypothetical protein